MGDARDARDADIAARACAPRQNLDIRRTETALLIMMLDGEQCAIVLWGADLEHMPDDEPAAHAELQRAMNEAAAEINRRIPIPKDIDERPTVAEIESAIRRDEDAQREHEARKDPTP